MPSNSDLGKSVIQAIRETLAARGLAAPATLGASTPIDGSIGLDSLDWAAVIVRLEETTGLDPFQKPVERELKVVQDLITLYEEARNA